MTDDPDEALARIRDRAERIRDRQVDRALARLDADDALTPAERAEIERLGDRLVERLLAVPAERLAERDERPGEVVDTALELFGRRGE